jgi:hypothetical protein
MAACVPGRSSYRDQHHEHNLEQWRASLEAFDSMIAARKGRRRPRAACRGAAGKRTCGPRSAPGGIDGAPARSAGHDVGALATATRRASGGAEPSRRRSRAAGSAARRAGRPAPACCAARCCGDSIRQAVRLPQSTRDCGTRGMPGGAVRMQLVLEAKPRPAILPRSPSRAMVGTRIDEPDAASRCRGRCARASARRHRSTSFRAEAATGELAIQAHFGLPRCMPVHPRGTSDSAPAGVLCLSQPCRYRAAAQGSDDASLDLRYSRHRSTSIVTRP